MLPAFGTVFQTCILSLSTFFLPFSVPPLHRERNKDREREKEKERGPGMVGTQSVKTAENNGIYHLILLKLEILKIHKSLKMTRLNKLKQIIIF